MDPTGLQRETFSTEDFTLTPQVTLQIFGSKQRSYRQLVLHLKLILCHMQIS